MWQVCVIREQNFEKEVLSGGEFPLFSGLKIRTGVMQPCNDEPWEWR